MRKNLKWIVAIVLVSLICSSITAFATAKIVASDITYSNDKSEAKNVEDALNDIYEKLKEENKEMHFETASTSVKETTSSGNFATNTFHIPEGIKEVKAFNVTTSTWGTDLPTVTGSIITNSQALSKNLELVSGNYETQLFEIDMDTNGNEGDIKITSKSSGYGCHVGFIVLCY